MKKFSFLIITLLYSNSYSTQTHKLTEYVASKEKNTKKECKFYLHGDIDDPTFVAVWDGKCRKDLLADEGSLKTYKNNREVHTVFQTNFIDGKMSGITQEIVYKNFKLQSKSTANYVEGYKDGKDEGIFAASISELEDGDVPESSYSIMWTQNGRLGNG